MTDLRDKIARALAEILDGQEAMHCTRGWEAWSVGTMSEDDFSLVTEDHDAFNEIVDAVLAVLDLDTVRADAVDEARRYMPFPIDPYNGFDHASLQGAYTQASNYLMDVADSYRRKAEQ